MTKTLRGHVDGFEGGFISGWAVYDSDNAACLIRILTSDGSELGRGRASHPREDLRSITNGHVNIAFRITVEYPADTDLLHVVVDDVPLDGSPIVMGPGIFDGAFVIDSGIVCGLVTERALNMPPPRVRFEDHYGRIVAEGLATFSHGRDPRRPALARIELPLRLECFGFDELEIRGFANDFEIGRNHCAARLVGYLDELSLDRCRGWLLSPDAPQHQFEIDVLCNGERVGSGHCEVPREDLKELYPLGWKVGFDLQLTRPNRHHGTSCRISIRIANSATELFDGPFLMRDRVEAIAAARRAAALVRASEFLAPEEHQAVELAVAELIQKRRFGPATIREPLDSSKRGGLRPCRTNIIIPIYKDVDTTRACIQSVLTTRDPKRDVIILVNDRSPEPDMNRMLADYTSEPRVYLLNNTNNLGFVCSVNRALSFCRAGHVVLLNSDTRVFAGAWDEMERLLDAMSGIGTITAISNNATIFSYPHATLVSGQPLLEASWEELAAEALAINRGCVVDVPTGHGFCMLIRREVLDRIGHLDTRFGRGYCEENDFCMRAADLGWRNVAACGVLVEHRESVSFKDEKRVLLEANQSQLDALYPEYAQSVMAFERSDALRVSRWPLDRLRLRRSAATGINYALIVQNWLDGGTKKAIQDIEDAYGYEGRERMTLTCRSDGMREIEVRSPLIHALFAPEDDEALFAMLDDANVDLVLVHQLLGETAGFVQRLGLWGSARQMKFYMHDFYTFCPRVTMLNAVQKFCSAADVDTCGRCVKLGGAHEASRMDGLLPTEHRELFRDFLQCCTDVIAPSTDTVSWAHRVFPDVVIKAAPHPQHQITFQGTLRDGDPNQVVLLGALGPHKGSRRLLDLARQARLMHPELRFHVVGHTDVDRELRAVGNVSITGPYRHEDLGRLVDRTQARVALFLHEWPETFSYTLSEAWSLGLWPVVPNLGAPSQRVRETGFGEVVDDPMKFFERRHLLPTKLPAPQLKVPEPANLA